ncbi:MAG: hypothetical protein WDN09_01125 [bacterium]
MKKQGKNGYDRLQPQYSHGPFSLQRSPEEFFYSLAAEKGTAKPKLISNGIPHVDLPALFVPIMTDSFRWGVLYYRNKHTTTASVLDNDTPYDLKTPASTLLVAKAANGKRLREATTKFRYRNVLTFGKPMTDVNFEKNELEAVSWIIGELTKLKKMGNYILSKDIPEGEEYKDCILKFRPFQEEDFLPEDVIHITREQKRDPCSCLKVRNHQIRNPLTIRGLFFCSS